MYFFFFLFFLRCGLFGGSFLYCFSLGGFDGDAVDGLVTLFLVTLAAVGEALGEVAAVAADLDLVLAIL